MRRWSVSERFPDLGVTFGGVFDNGVIVERGVATVNLFCVD